MYQGDLEWLQSLYIPLEPGDRPLRPREVNMLLRRLRDLCIELNERVRELEDRTKGHGNGFQVEG